jgi:hypothetical protein
MSEDLIKVVLDYNFGEFSDKEKISTGKFIKIHSGEKILSPNFLPNKNFDI